MRHFDDDKDCIDPACPKIHACGQPDCGWEISHKRRVAVGKDWFCRRCAERLLKRLAKSPKQ